MTHNKPTAAAVESNTRDPRDGHIEDDLPVTATHPPDDMDRLTEAAARLDLPYSAAFTIVEQRVGVRSNREDLLSAITTIWHPFPRCGDDEPVDREYALIDFEQAGVEHPWSARFGAIRDGRFVFGSRQEGDVVDYIDWLGASRALVGATGRAVYHSAVLDDGSGERGLLLPAASGSGKTTLTAALVRAGFDYLSDEAALVDLRTHEVHTYPKVLSIKQPDVLIRLLALPPDIAGHAPSEQGTIWHLDPALLRPGCRRKTTRVRVIIFPKYEPGSTTALTPLSRATGALHLLRSAVNEHARPQRGVELATALATNASCYRLTINDLDEAVRLVKQVFETGVNAR